MSNNVYKFPGSVGVAEPSALTPEASPKKLTGTLGAAKKLLSHVVKVLWFVMALVWPFLRWVMALDVFFHGALMVWHWDTPGSYAGVTFLLHFAALVGMTFFVSIFKPKGVK